jgi:hypothetical protein
LALLILKQIRAIASELQAYHSFKGLVTMKTILYLNVILSMGLMLLALWSFGHSEITEIQFLLVTLFSVFTGIVSLYEAEVQA